MDRIAGLFMPDHRQNANITKKLTDCQQMQALRPTNLARDSREKSLRH